jgi:sterol desaturase/sphingolipid hydroxylase (fatty acid hydroxylase superfamily)
MDTHLFTLLDNLVDSTFFVIDPTRRLFWLSIISSVMLVLLVLKLQGRRLNWRMLRHVFLSKRYWLNSSTRTDLRWFSVNCGVKAILATIFLGSQLVITMAVALALQSEFGTFSATALPWLTIAIIYTLVFFVAEDFSRFLLHVAMHRVPFLWQLHKVHHSATTLTPLTVHRVHPVETCLYFARGILVFGLISGFFIYCFGNQLTALDILGVDALGFLFNLVGANLRHSHIWLSFGRVEKFLISPAQHQIHHSSHELHRDTNFGTCLSIWDRSIGSWRSAGPNKLRLSFGLPATNSTHNSEFTNSRISPVSIPKGVN